MTDASCAHDNIAADWEGWQNPGEPLVIVLICWDCHRRARIVEADPDLLEWTDD
jgi:hypothetical protein